MAPHRIGRRALLAGAAGSQRLFGVLLLGPFALLPPMAVLAHAPTLLLPLALLPAAWRLRRDFIACPPGLAFNGVLFRSFRLELAYAGLLSAGAVVAPWLAALGTHGSGA